MSWAQSYHQGRTRVCTLPHVKYIVIGLLLFSGSLLISAGWSSVNDIPLPGIETGDQPINDFSERYGNIAAILTVAVVVFFLLRRGVITITWQTLESRLQKRKSEMKQKF